MRTMRGAGIEATRTKVSYRAYLFTYGRSVAGEFVGRELEGYRIYWP